MQDEKSENKGVSCKSLLDILKKGTTLAVNGREIAGSEKIPLIREASEKISHMKCRQRLTGEIDLSFQNRRREVEDSSGVVPNGISEVITQVSCVFVAPKIVGRPHLPWRVDIE